MRSLWRRIFTPAAWYYYIEEYSHTQTESDQKVNITRSESLARVVNTFSQSHYPLGSSKVEPSLMAAALADLHISGSSAFFDLEIATEQKHRQRNHINSKISPC